MRSDFGAASVLYGRDEQGREIEVLSLDENGQRTLRVEGWASYEIDRDADGAEVGRRYYDAQGNEIQTHPVLWDLDLTPSGDAYAAGLRNGDVLLRWNARSIETVADLPSAEDLAEAEVHEVVVHRDGRPLRLAVPPAALRLFRDVAVSTPPRS